MIDATRAALVLGFLAAGATPAQASPELAQKHACLACHAMDKKVIGPSYQEVAKKYAGQPDAQAKLANLLTADGPPPLPTGSRRVVVPGDVTRQAGEFVAEVGVGIVHHHEPWVPPAGDARAALVAAALKSELDPNGRLNPGVDA